jgi:two-component system, NtrC family, response regulator HydG
VSAPGSGRVLVVDDEANITDSVRRALERVGYGVDTARDIEEAWAKLERTVPDVVLCDVRLQDKSGMDLLTRIRECYPELAVIMMTGYASIESAVAAMKTGATDYLAKPFDPSQLRHAVAKAIEQRRLVQENLYLKSELQQLDKDRVVFGESRVMQELFRSAQTVAATDSSVLITGGSGTGKEVLARFIHSSSARRDRPFVTVNCAAIPATLIESELFGHRRGAFTGAVYNRRGSFEAADGGTLFLDEIGEMPLEMQAKILRAIEERRIQRVGATEPVAVDARIIAATNRDLQVETAAGRFREDLYWRLDVVQFTMPTLAERPEDVVPLARHFLAFYAREQKKPARDFSPEVLDTFARYAWPGNVRELRNAVERAVIFAEPGQPIRLAHLPPHLRQTAQRPEAPPQRELRTLREIEADYIHEVLEACGGNRAKAAQILGLSVVTLWRKLKRDAAEDQEDDETRIGG